MSCLEQSSLEVPLGYSLIPETTMFHFRSTWKIFFEDTELSFEMSMGTVLPLEEGPPSNVLLLVGLFGV